MAEGDGSSIHIENKHVTESQHSSNFRNISNNNCERDIVSSINRIQIYQTDLPRKVVFVYEVECWKIRWALVDAKPEKLLDTIHAPNVTYIRLYTASSVSPDNAGVISTNREIF